MNKLISLIFTLLFSSLCYANIAVKGETIYTMEGAVIKNGVVLIKDGRIEAIGTQEEINIPASYVLKEAKVVTPGLIDGRATVGLSGALNQEDDQDQLDTNGPIQPELRAIDAYNPHDPLVEHLRRLGITTVNTGHGHGAVSSGQTMLIKTYGNSVADALIDDTATVVFNLGPGVSRAFDKPGTRSKAVSMLRAELLNAQDYAEKLKGDEKDKPARNLRHEILAKVLNKEVPALIKANHANDIMTALRLQKEFGFDMILDGAAESYLIMEHIKAAGVPVILHPSMVRTYGETKNASFETAKLLVDEGITVVTQSSYEGYVPKTRVVLFEAALWAANGLTFEQALASITIDAAKTLGVDDRIGSLKVGKDADLALFNGDPFEYITQVCTVIIDGNIVADECF